MPFRLLGASFVVALMAGTAPAVAQTPQPDPTPSPSRSPSPTRPPFVAGYKNGFVLQSETGDFVLKLTGYAQADGRFALDDGAAAVTDQFLVRRSRAIFQGTVAQYYDFYLNADFGGGTGLLQDAYVDVRHTSKLRLRAGKIKVPFGIERLQSGAHTLFVERALPNNLVPNRDIGVQLHGELAGGAVAYQAAVLNGVADGGSADTDTSDSKDVAGRLFLTPFKTRHTSPLRNLGFGIAGTRGEATGALRGYSSVSQVSVFSYLTTVTANGERTRVSPQASFFAGPVGFLAEYVQARHDVRKADTSGANVEGELTNSAWSLTGSWLITGEEATYGFPKPKSFFSPKDGKWGALQLVARYNVLEVDADTFPTFADPARSVREARAWGVGLNWIWNSHVRYVADYEQTSFTGGAAGGADRAAEKSVQTRLHLSF